MDAILGVELGSTRIKAVLTDANHTVLAQGSHTWENDYQDGVWTYPLDAVWVGLRAAVTQALDALPSVQVRAMGFSGMMHGYLAFDGEGRLLVPFRTWRNTFTAHASQELTALFGFPIPQRWSIAHLYHAMLQNEPHVRSVHRLSTLASYVHETLTGRRAVGVGEASGMFPIDAQTLNYDQRMLSLFDERAHAMGMPWHIRELLPEALPAGACAGYLTQDGAQLLDPAGRLQAGIPLAPPEGDAGTGMAATNAVRPRTGNVSAGTSIFSMVVLERPLSRVYPQLDVVATPDGSPVAMVHCNNCTSDINAWAGVFGEFAALAGQPLSTDALYTRLFSQSLHGEPDCGGVTVINYLSGEHVTGFERGCPLIVRNASARLTLSNLMRAQLYSALATLAIGMKSLREENVTIDMLTGHGGFFKTPGVGQQYLANAVDAPVRCMMTAGEGGAYGMTLLTAYMLQKDARETLPDFLDNVFANAQSTALSPDPVGRAGFEAYDVHMTDLLTGRITLEDFVGLAVCGGFSYGDVLGAGGGWSKTILHNAMLSDMFSAFFNRTDTFALGICNGCQLFVELGLIYPDHADKPAMWHNDSHKHECSFVNVDIPENHSVMFSSLAGARLGVWVSHGEGKFHLPLSQDAYHIAARYTYSGYPGNPNGSDYDVAALASADGRHLVMMPHIERSIHPWAWAYCDPAVQRQEVSPWIEAFVNARKWVEQHRNDKK